LIAPNNSSDYSNVKDLSAVIKLTYGNDSFLFTGDAMYQSEGEMLESAFALKSTVLKVSNHGDKASSSHAFISAVSPKYAVISVGKGNSNGNPSKEIIDRLTQAGAQIFRTDESGTIVATSDGLTLNIDKAAASGQASASAPASPAATN
jgi:beta-lactamase superfamily II metal-dependent hydrolase